MNLFFFLRCVSYHKCDACKSPENSKKIQPKNSDNISFEVSPPEERKEKSEEISSLVTTSQESSEPAEKIQEKISEEKKKKSRGPPAQIFTENSFSFE